MARQKLGQHFLRKGRILERIAATACPETEPLVIEIGPGRGALTERLLPRSQRVVAIEIDAYLGGYLREKFSSDPHLIIIPSDARQTDLSQWGRTVVVGNLPYYAATEILQQVLELGPCLKRAVFLVQREVAARVTAKPGHREYGFLTVSVQLRANAELLFLVRPPAFYPRPKVDSAVLRLEPRCRAAELGIQDRGRFLEFVSRCFRQKRKTIRNNLASFYGEQVRDWPEASLRAEQLSLEQFADMYRRVALT